MKKLKKCAALLLTLTLGAAFLLAACSIDVDGHQKKLSEKSWPLAKVDKLIISHNAGFYLYNEQDEEASGADVLLVEEYESEGRRNTGPSIENLEGWTTYSSRRGQHIWAFLPAQYSGELQLLSEEGAVYCGDRNLSPKTLTVRSARGLTLKEVSTQEMQLYCSEGLLRAASLQAASIGITAFRADVILGYTEGRMQAEAQHGDVYIHDFRGSGSLSQEGGRCELTLNALDDDLQIKSQSGGITIYLPKELPCQIIAHTESGTLLVPGDFPPVQSGEYHHAYSGGGPVLRLLSEEGNIRIKYAEEKDSQNNYEQQILTYIDEGVDFHNRHLTLTEENLFGEGS